MNPWGPFFFRIINIQSYCPFPARLSLLNDIIKVFPIKMHYLSSDTESIIGDLCCRKICQGHHRVMIYIHIVVLEPSMLHAKFH